jgi:hypothetical protein
VKLYFTIGAASPRTITIPGHGCCLRIVVCIADYAPVHISVSVRSRNLPLQPRHTSAWDTIPPYRISCFHCHSGFVLTDRNPGTISGFEPFQEAALQKLLAIVFALTLMSAAAVAQIPTAGNVFLGYSYNRGSTGVSGTGNLNGWEASFEGRVIPHIGIVADFGETYGNFIVPTFVGNFTSNTRITTYMFGPRVSASIGKFRPFAHVLIGAAHLSQPDVSYAESDFSDAIGGGIDYHLIPMVAWRVQVDDLQTRFNGGLQNDTRLSTGIALHF